MSKKIEQPFIPSQARGSYTINGAYVVKTLKQRLAAERAGILLPTISLHYGYKRTSINIIEIDRAKLHYRHKKKVH